MRRWKGWLMSLVLVSAPVFAEEEVKEDKARAEESKQEDEWASAPQAEPVHTLIGKREMAGGYGLFSVERGKFKDDAILTFYGLRLGWMLTRTFGIGVSTSSLVTEHRAPSGNNMGLDYYGVSFETTLFPRAAAHLNFVITGGEGHLKDEDPDSGKVKRRDILTFVEPEINLEMNMTTWFRILIGYRQKFVSGIDTAGFDAKDLDLSSAHIGFKFGQF